MQYFVHPVDCPWFLFLSLIHFGCPAGEELQVVSGGGVWGGGGYHFTCKDTHYVLSVLSKSFCVYFNGVFIPGPNVIIGM